MPFTSAYLQHARDLPPKVGWPKRDRAKVKAARKARHR